MTFPNFCRSLGIIPPDAFTPGRAQRVATETHPKKKNAVVKLDEDERSGFALNYESSQSAIQWRDGNAEEITEEQRAKQRDAMRARIAEKRAEEKRGTMRAKALYEGSTVLLHANHEYLRKKRLDMQGCRGLKVDKDGWLVVPMYVDGRLVSCQRISPDGDKRFITGAPTKWAHFTIWRPGATATLIAEGLATGLTVFSAVPQAIVQCCFSASNMVAYCKRNGFAGMVAIAADNDHWTQEATGKNAGIEAAQEAAKVLGCGYAAPTCDGTDWNDFMIERMTILEKQDERSIRARSPAEIRKSSLMPIRVALMGALRNVSSNDTH